METIFEELSIKSDTLIDYPEFSLRDMVDKGGADELIYYNIYRIPVYIYGNKVFLGRDMSREELRKNLAKLFAAMVLDGYYQYMDQVQDYITEKGLSTKDLESDMYLYISNPSDNGTTFGAVMNDIYLDYQL